MNGIRHVVETKGDGDIIALGVARNIDEADDLQARVQEQAPGQGVRMRLIERESQAGAADTWLDLADRQAKGAPRAP